MCGECRLGIWFPSILRAPSTNGCASSGQQKGGRAADATARASNRDHFPVDACHIASSFEELEVRRSNLKLRRA